MKQPEFNFGDRVVPTRKAFRAGVFPYEREGTIFGLVVWAKHGSVIVHQKGRKTATSYASCFWTKEAQS
jgi:hypothetical protein